MYLDANNLHGWAMSKFLPKVEFKWINYKVSIKCNSNSLKGFVSEVDLEYPKELHDLRNDYPLAPDKIKEILSDYPFKISRECDILIGNVKNLVPKICPSLWKLAALFKISIKI